MFDCMMVGVGLTLAEQPIPWGRVAVAQLGRLDHQDREKELAFAGQLAAEPPMSCLQPSVGHSSPQVRFLV